MSTQIYINKTKLQNDPALHNNINMVIQDLRYFSLYSIKSALNTNSLVSDRRETTGTAVTVRELVAGAAVSNH